MEKGNEIKTVIPTLRFPEFQDTVGWKEYKLKSLCEIGNGKDYKHLGRGNIPVYGSGGYMTSVDDFLYDGESVCIGRKGTIDKPIFLTGKFWTVDTLFYTHSFHNCLPKFLYLIFQKINWYKHNEAGGVPSLSKTTIGEINVFVPVGKNGELKEQQKIVDCIFSLDELIEATTQKVEALKEHKKGLMQRLFPAEDKNVPDLRFSEFQGMKGWEKTYIYEECPNIYSGGTPKTTEKKYYGGDIPFIRSAEIGKDKTELFITQEGLNNSSAKMVQKGDLLIALYGANSGDIAISKIDGAINQAILCLKAKNNNLFIYYGLLKIQKDIVSKYLQGGQGNLSGEIIKSIDFYIPQGIEQQKIADCLFSLDELIEATSRKVEILKEHKKGLMQQLFPKI